MPICWTAPDLSPYCDVSAVVMCEPGPAGDWTPCVDQVRTLEGDPTACAAKLATLPLRKNTRPW